MDEKELEKLGQELGGDVSKDEIDDLLNNKKRLTQEELANLEDKSVITDQLLLSED